ncbi:hypothetical protein GPROT2_00966 [Gammaproteobacteria bacterium]|nr:ribosome-associated translation inhibitor RaiA [Gammaproteobacteria bacterium]QOJ30878.1 MAG: ribosome-associated translation inhibitor RaiA [Gammaproteobacteria bacterium]CAG0940559.1 hypothetical protein GPROT2_00966 [Gammaproteobacteria bacterium]
MQTALQVRFHGTDPSAAMEFTIREHVQKLEQFYDGLIGCQVSLESRHQHHRQGNLFTVHIRLVVPGEELVVTRNPERDPRHEDPYVAVSDAFRAARRQLEEYAGKRHGKTKRHQARPRSQGSGAAAQESEQQGD